MRQQNLHHEDTKITKWGSKTFLAYIFFVFFVSSWLVPTIVPTIVLAQAPVPDDETYHIAKKLNCPTCAGRNLADCPTETCTQWKAEIKSQLNQGKNAQEVLAYFEARFGPTVLQEPPKQGSTALLWAAPVGAAIVFFAVVAFVMMRMSRRSPTPAMTTTAPGSGADPFVAELEREVKDES
jgi:cytochrome c-type biogenesis protein CcmH/NrfF